MRHVSRGNLAISKLLRKAEEGVSTVSAKSNKTATFGILWGTIPKHLKILLQPCEICEDEWLWYRIHQGFSDMKETK